MQARSNLPIRRLNTFNRQNVEAYTPSVIILDLIDNISSIVIEVVTQLILGFTLIIQTMAVFLSVHKAAQSLYSNIVNGLSYLFQYLLVYYPTQYSRKVDSDILSRNICNFVYVYLCFYLLDQKDLNISNNQFVLIILQSLLQKSHNYNYNEKINIIETICFFIATINYQSYMLLYDSNNQSILSYLMINRCSIDLILISSKFYVLSYNKSMKLTSSLIDLFRCSMWTYVTFCIFKLYYIKYLSYTVSIPLTIKLLAPIWAIILCKDILYAIYLIHYILLLLYYEFKIKSIFRFINKQILTSLQAENEKCSICLGTHTLNSVKLPCNHVFHYTCAHDMIITHNNKKCPICRNPFEHQLPIYSLNQNDHMSIISTFIPSYNLSIYNPFISLDNRHNNDVHRNHNSFDRQPTILPILSLGLNQLSTHMGPFITESNAAISATLGLNPGRSIRDIFSSNTNPIRIRNIFSTNPSASSIDASEFRRIHSPTPVSIAPPLPRPLVTRQSYRIVTLTYNNSDRPVTNATNEPTTVSSSNDAGVNRPSVSINTTTSNNPVITRDPSNSTTVSDNNEIYNILNDEVIANLLYHWVTEEDSENERRMAHDQSYPPNNTSSSNLPTVSTGSTSSSNANLENNIPSDVSIDNQLASYPVDINSNSNTDTSSPSILTSNNPDTDSSTSSSDSNNDSNTDSSSDIIDSNQSNHNSLRSRKRPRASTSAINENNRTSNNTSSRNRKTRRTNI